MPSASTRSTRPGRPGADEQIAGLVEGERRRVRRLRLVERRALAVRRDLVDDALLAGAREDVALRVDGERPDVLVVRIEEGRRRAVAIDLVDPAVRRRADVEAAVRRRRQRVHFELGASKNSDPLPCGVDAEDLALVAGADEERAIGPRQHRPEKRRRRLVDELGRRAERRAGRRLSIERFSTSPFRKSACVAAWKNFGDDASSGAASARGATVARQRHAQAVESAYRVGRSSRSVRRDGDRQRPRAADGVLGRELPFAERRAAQRVEVAAVAIGFEHAEHRRRQRRQQLRR